LKFQRMIKFCHAKGIHSGCDWTKVSVLEA
jgi:hypothetical protein